MLANIVGVTGVVVLLLGLIYVMGESRRAFLAFWFSCRRYRVFLLPVAGLVFYSILTLVVGQWNAGSFWHLCWYLALPAIVIYFFAGSSGKVSWVDVAVALLVWLPIELGIVQRDWIDMNIGVKHLSYQFTTFMAAIFIMVAYSAYRAWPFNCRWKLTLKDLKVIVVCYVALSLVLIPLGLPLQFLKLRLCPELVLHPWYVYFAPLVLASFFFAPGFVEELLFRGVIQHIFVSRFGRWRGLLCGALVFGLAHINNRAGIYHPPNFVYVFFASLAGLAYGYTYLRTRSLVASALLHAIVDFSWLLFLKG